MPKKYSRSVNDLNRSSSISGFFGSFAQGSIIFLAAVVALFSGGIASPGLLLVIIFPVAIAVLTSWGDARPALLCAIVSLLGLELMSMFD